MISGSTKTINLKILTLLQKIIIVVSIWFLSNLFISIHVLLIFMFFIKNFVLVCTELKNTVAHLSINHSWSFLTIISKQCYWIYKIFFLKLVDLWAGICFSHMDYPRFFRDLLIFKTSPKLLPVEEIEGLKIEKLFFDFLILIRL